MSLEPTAPTTASFSTRTVLVLVAAGVLSFSALAVLASFAPELRTGGDNGANALSRSAIGFGGLVKLLKTMGDPVVISRSKATPPRAQALMMLTPDVGDKLQDINRLSDGGPSLVVLPKWLAAPDLRNPDWVSRGRTGDLSRLNSRLVHRLTGGTAVRDKGVATVQLRSASGEPLGAVSVASLQTLTGGDLTPVVVDAKGRVVLARRPDRNQYILADPDVLNTYGLRSLQGARTALAVLDKARPSPRSAIFFDVTLNGFERSRSLWKLAFEPPFLAATLCAFVAALLMGLHAAIRFGAPTPEDRAFGFGKRALADNQASLIRMAKREGRMAAPYAALIRDQVARAVGAGSVTEETKLEALLDRLGAARAHAPLSSLMAEARRVSDPAGLMRVARGLYQWKLEMTRERH